MAALRIDRGAFLSRHWQREPLLIPAALPDFTPPLTPDEIAGLALEAEVESRIVEYAAGAWRLHHGPFQAHQFQRAHPWTLLVQAVDHWIPAVAGLRDLVDFIPDWRIDDVMVSYAGDGGSAGPHYDHYDVFLLQGDGEKLWRIGQRCPTGADVGAQDGELRILSDFHCREEHLLRRGDVLYLPPGVAHWGIARGESTTYSLGFRTPRINDMVSRYVDALLEQLDPDRFLADASRPPASRAGELTDEDIRNALTQVEAALREAPPADWFGELVTEPRYDCHPRPAEVSAARERLGAPGTTVSLDPSSKVAWHRDGDGFTLYANGASLACEIGLLPAVEALCGRKRLAGAELAALQERRDGPQVLEFLLQAGCIDVD